MKTSLIPGSVSLPAFDQRSDTQPTHATGGSDALPSSMMLADALFKHADSHLGAWSSSGVPHLERLIDCGRSLQQAEELLGSGKFESALDAGGKIGCTPTTARRYMRLARHAGAIRAAGFTYVKDADKWAQKLEDAQMDKANESPAPQPTTLAATHGKRIFNDMRRLPAADQPGFIAEIVGRLTRLNELFD